jgi:hypothetical protein
MSDAEQNASEPKAVGDFLDLLGHFWLQGDKFDSVGLRKTYSPCWSCMSSVSTYPDDGIIG